MPARANRGIAPRTLEWFPRLSCIGNLIDDAASARREQIANECENLESANKAALGADDRFRCVRNGGKVERIDPVAYGRV